VVTASNTLVDSAFTQSYHMFVARKDDDKIKDVSFISMSSHDSSISASYKSGSNINQNFITASSMTSTGKNLLMGESLSGSIAEIRAWENYVSMSKFKQHVINYQSVVGNKISSSVAEVIYRFKLDEGIPDWSLASNSASLKIHDSNPNKIKDYSHFISTQPKPNFRSTTTEQTFYKLAVKGTDRLPNDNQTNLAPTMTSVGQLNPNVDIVSDPKNPGTLQRVYSNRFGRDMSYVNTIDSLIMNMLPDFRIDDFIGDPDEDLTETYQDLLKLRKSIIQDSNISVNIVDNQRSVENLVNNSVVENLNLILRNGDIIEELRDEVQTYNYDVAIIGGSGKRSMAHDLIQYIDSSIFIVNNFNLKQDYRILLAVDDSSGTAKAVKYGVRVAQAFGIDVDLVTISRDNHFGEGYKNASARAAKLMRRSGVAAETLFKVGEPVNTIVEIAGNNHIIIMGASTQSPIAKFFIGSKPLNVIEACNCPVLIVK